MVGAHGLVVARDADAEVALVLTQFVGLGMVVQTGQFETESGLAVSQVDDRERVVLGLFAADLLQSERPVVELDAALQIADIDIEMIETCFDFHNRRILRRAKVDIFK